MAIEFISLLLSKWQNCYFFFFMAMTGALAPFSYLVIKYQFTIKFKKIGTIQSKL